MTRQIVLARTFGCMLILSSAIAMSAQETMPEVGQAAPDFTLVMLDGDALTLSERRAEGPVVLVFFRGAW